MHAEALFVADLRGEAALQGPAVGVCALGAAIFRRAHRSNIGFVARALRAPQHSLSAMGLAGQALERRPCGRYFGDEESTLMSLPAATTSTRASRSAPRDVVAPRRVARGTRDSPKG